MTLSQEEIALLIKILNTYIPIAAPVVDPEEDELMQALLQKLEKSLNDTN